MGARLFPIVYERVMNCIGGIGEMLPGPSHSNALVGQ
jgi:hypothetical protein